MRLKRRLALARWTRCGAITGVYGERDNGYVLTCRRLRFHPGECADPISFRAWDR